MPQPPAANVRGRNRGAYASSAPETRVFTPACARRDTIGVLTTATAGRAKSRPEDRLLAFRSPTILARSRRRAIIPAAARTKRMFLPAREDDRAPVARGKTSRRCRYGNGQLRMESSAVRADNHAEGGSTNNRACRSRQNFAATSNVLRPTSLSRVSGGIHNKLKDGTTPFSANIPVPSIADPMTS